MSTCGEMSGTVLAFPDAHSRLVDDIKQQVLKGDLNKWKSNIKVNTTMVQDLGVCNTAKRPP